MTDESLMGGRVGRLEISVAGVLTDLAGLKIQLEGQNTTLATIGSAVNRLGDKFDGSRPSISTIWAPIGALIAMVTLIGGAVAVPQLQRVERIEVAKERMDEQLILLRIDNGIAKHDLAIARAKP